MYDFNNVSSELESYETCFFFGTTALFKNSMGSYGDIVSNFSHSYELTNLSQALQGVLNLDF